MEIRPLAITLAALAAALLTAAPAAGSTVLVFDGEHVKRIDDPPPPGSNRHRTVCTTAARIASGPRVQFKGDPLTLQYYPGVGLRLQPLANWGSANALYNACKGINTKPGTPCEPDKLRNLLDRLVAMGANRHGFLAWEYYFPIYGGKPPWVSGIAEGSALSALAHGAEFFQ